MEFQNTIAYGQFYNAGGVVDITTDYVALAFTPIVNLAKNIHIASDEDNELIYCGDFECASPLTDWTVNVEGAISVDSGKLKVLNVTGRGRAYTNITGLTIGKTYRFYVKNTIGTLTGFCHLSSGSTYNNIPLNTFFYFIAGSTALFIECGVILTNINGFTYFDDLSLVATNDFGVYVEQTGSYFLDFSFIAEDGDNVVYSFAPFINGVEQLGSIDFYQQATTQEYEVGSNYIFDLTEGDFISFKVKTASVSATAFIIKDIKLNIFNLQQLGIH